ncbi:MAG: glycoside hydrolase family 9 protein [Bacteroidota bacterium]
MSRVSVWFIHSLIICSFYACTLSSAGSLQKNDPAGSANIRLNQLGFYPQGPKIAIVLDSLGGAFYLKSSESQEVKFEGTLGEEKYWEFSGENVRQADFSTFKEPGAYYLETASGEKSYPFSISPDLNLELHKASLKSYYFQRASLALDKTYAGDWERDAGHIDEQIKVHASAASSARPEGSIISAPKGWYDAGDYGKYTANAAYTSWIMFHLYEQFPAQLSQWEYAIPESGNKSPDLLDEALWSLEWLLKMQDPSNGMVYHKLTGLKHPPKVMPHEDQAERFVIGKSTGSNFAYAAFMAQAGRILAGIDRHKDLSQSCIEAARKAWQWGLEHPKVFFQNSPDVHTGQYKDGNAEDERLWAAVELFISTGDKSYLDYLQGYAKFWNKAPGWNSTGVLAWMSINLHRDKFPERVAKTAKERTQNLAEAYAKVVDQHPYHILLGRDKYDIIWGSNGIAASAGMCMIHAYLQEKDKRYLDAATEIMDYLAGRNATGYCFITGFGSKSPKDIHHRPSAADGVEEPIPGFLVGGPQGEKNYDGCNYPSEYPAAFYTDHWCSYSTNEVCLNWNAPLVYLSAGLEILYQ